MHDILRRPAFMLNASVAALILAVPATAGAQTAEPHAADSVDTVATGEIIVTSQRRQDRLQDVPLAVTAIGGEKLASRQINDTVGLVAAVPSLTFQSGSNATNSTFRIRGVGTALFSQGVEPSVSIVVDGVVSARQAQSFADFADIERIEVLRGPQGTLFGKNATAGVINIVTARPTDQLSGSVNATIAEKDEYRVKGTISGPIAEGLKARVSGYYNNVGGHLYNVTRREETGGNEGWGVRGKLEWQATDNLNLLFTADYRKSSLDCCRTVLVSTENDKLAGLYAPVVASYDNRQVIENAKSYQKVKQATYSLEANWDLGPATVTSTTAYQTFKNFASLDVDAINTPTPIFLNTGSTPTKADQHGSVDLNNFTQELRIGSNGKQALTYVAGVYYSKVNVTRDFFLRRALCSDGVFGEPCATEDTTWQSGSSISHLDSQSLSAFGQVEYNVWEGLNLIAGARYQYEKISVAGTRVSPALDGDTVIPGNASISGKRSADDTALTGKLGAKYEFSRNAQAYASYTRGYKGLGFDTELTANFATQNAVQPEHVDAYEIGFKGRTLDGQLSFGLAIYQADYSNLQIQANRSDPDTGIVRFVTTNAGKSRSRGVELETTWRPSRNFSLDGSVTYNRATVSVDGLNCPLQNQAAAPILTGNYPINSCYRSQTTVNGAPVTSGPLQDVRGVTLPVSPKWKVVLSPRYEHEIGSNGLNAFGQVNFSFQSRQGFTIEQDSMLVQDAYAMVDVNVGVNNPDRGYSVTLFVKNLFDQNYVSGMAHGGTLASTSSPKDLYAIFNKDSQRYFGANFGYKF